MKNRRQTRPLLLLGCLVILGTASASQRTQPPPANKKPPAKDSKPKPKVVYKATKQTKNKIRAMYNEIVHSYSSTLSKVLKGDLAGAIPADLYGQTLDQEIAACPFELNRMLDTYINQNNLYSNIKEYDLSDMTDKELKSKTAQEKNELKMKKRQLMRQQQLAAMDPTHNRKLYGGAQYHRAMAQFHTLIENIPVDKSTSDEIALLIQGIPDNSHNGVNLLRSVAKLSSRKMQLIMDEVLVELAKRMEFVLKRMWDVVEYTQLVRSESDIRSTLSERRNWAQYKYIDFTEGSASNFADQDETQRLKDLEADLIKFAKQKYNEFVRQKCELAYALVKEDVEAMFKFVSWDLAFGDRFQSSIGVDGCIVKIEGLDEEDDAPEAAIPNETGRLDLAPMKRKPGNILDPATDEILRNVVDAVKATMEKSGTGESMAQTCAAVNVLVGYVTNRWRKDITSIISTKFNAFCVLPLHKEFAGYLRREIEIYMETNPLT